MSCYLRLKWKIEKKIWSQHLAAVGNIALLHQLHPQSRGGCRLTQTRNFFSRKLFDNKSHMGCDTEVRKQVKILVLECDYKY